MHWNTDQWQFFFTLFYEDEFAIEDHVLGFKILLFFEYFLSDNFCFFSVYNISCTNVEADKASHEIYADCQIGENAQRIAHCWFSFKKKTTWTPGTIWS